ncbi:MAG TPA: tRNA 2-selenouridine(34) synthase MnmH [Bacteroidales bacterium]|nr:tRNA 2-selenouridine(34) synthase MnmH [Bacteroidales bacterium]
MVHKINIEEFLANSQLPAIDVRSPAEFAQGHIPGAVNIALFDDAERATVGKLYKSAGREAAIMRGLDIVGPKMSSFVKAAQRVAPGKEIRIHCWRGGMRSESLAWLFSTTGFEVYLLEGGYKNYRRHIRQALDADAYFVILSGKTGTGKTEILHTLHQQGEQILDLEGLAHHKGSAFGAIGELPQPTTEQFENDLFEAFKTLNPEKPIWIEDESRSVGKVIIPDPFFTKMRNSSVISLDMPQPLRIQRLVKDYASYPAEELIDALQHIIRRLGGQHAAEAIAAIRESDFETAIRITLDYYDKTYSFGLEKRDEKKVHTIATDTADAKENAAKVLNFLKQISSHGSSHLS